MSVFGGDSWGREAQYRKRRVDDLLAESVDDLSFKKLSNGKYACLVCPHNPILDTPLIISMHRKGSRHLVSESKLKAKELKKQEEISKRIALSDSSTCTTKPNTYSKKYNPAEKPLIKHAQKIISEVLSGETSTECSKKEQPFIQKKKKKEQPTVSLNTSNLLSSNFSTTSSLPATVVVDGALTLQHFDLRGRRERELKFTAAGWKRDGHGKWYKDENVEFDSDEEDPNI